MGIEAVWRLIDDLLPAFELRFVGLDLHRAAVAALLAPGTRDVSMVDRVSFELMRNAGVTHAFAYDRNFERAGFTLFT